MNRVTEIVIYLGLSGYFTASYMVDFQARTVRWIALAGFLLIGAATQIRVVRQSSSPVDKFMTAYLFLGAVGFWFWPEGLGRILAGYPLPLLYAVFFLGVVLPPLLGGRLFTLHWAKPTVDKAVWETDLFISINRFMTAVWSVLFLVSGGVALIPILIPALNTTLWRLVFGFGGPLVVLLGLGAPFNKWYPAHRQRKLGIDPSMSQPGAFSAQEPGPDTSGVSESPTPDPTPNATIAASTRKENEMASHPLVVAVNGSPRPDISNTGILIEMMRPTLEEEGFNLEVINLAQKNINYCLGDAWCLDKGQCWQRDDQKEVMSRILEADAVILGCPVYIMNVPAQMKTFLDRSLPLGHKPRDFWKPGLTVCVSTGLAETEVAAYLGKCLKIFGAFSLGSLTAMGSGGPDEFVGREHVLTRAADLARYLALAVREKRRLPATDQDLHFYQFMGGLVKRSREFMHHDYEHWEKLGIFDSFEAYIQQEANQSPMNDPAIRKAWFKELMSQHQEEKEMSPETNTPQGAADAQSCKQLIEIMPLGFQPQAAKDLKAVIQFDISGDEEFTAHLAIADGKAVHHDGPAENPDLTVKAPAKVWLGISRGEINGQMAFMTGKFKAQGDLGLLLKLNSLFKG